MDDPDDPHELHELSQVHPTRRLVGTWVMRAIWWVCYPLIAAAALYSGIHQHLTSEAFRGGMSAHATFSDVQEYTGDTRGGTSHQWSGQLVFLAADGQTYTVTVTRQNTKITDGEGATVSYRPADPADGRWVHDNDDAVGLIVIGVALIVGRGLALGTSSVRRRARRRQPLPRLSS